MRSSPQRERADLISPLSQYAGKRFLFITAFSDCTVGILSNARTIAQDTLDRRYSLPPAFSCRAPMKSAGAVPLNPIGAVALEFSSGCRPGSTRKISRITRVNHAAILIVTELTKLKRRRWYYDAPRAARNIAVDSNAMILELIIIPAILAGVRRE